MMCYLIATLILIVILLMFGLFKYSIESIKKHKDTLEILKDKKEILLKEQFLLNKKIVTSVLFNTTYQERLNVLNREIVSLQKLFLELILKKQ